jgi:hypothetical protein
VVGLAVLAGCGVPDSGPATTVPPEKVPYGLLGTSSPAAPPRRGTEAALGPAAYFTRADGLVRIGLRVPGGGDPRRDLAEVLESLATGPTAGEQAAGIGSAVPAGLRLAVLRLADGRVEIDLRGEVAHPDVGQNALFAAQIVLTATSVPGVERVGLSREGQPVRPVLPGGELAASDVGRADYVGLLAPAGPRPAPAGR